MRTSSQLTKIQQCEKHPHANLTQTTDDLTRIGAQREVLLRMLMGEPIDDIRGEINSILVSKNCPWETREQETLNLGYWDARIRRFFKYEEKLVENEIERVFPFDMDTEVDFFGEIIKAKPDYFRVDGNVVTVVKIKTGRFKSETEDLSSYEAYALGLCGEKLFPGKQIVVEFCHLADSDQRKERQYLIKDYEDSQKTSRRLFDREMKEFFANKHEQEAETEYNCTPEECASCPNHNICFFEEPPISVDIYKEVKPISEIRLTNAQRQVVDYEEGTARINAGAGAGKTLVIAMRIVELLRKGYQPEEICLLTFTKAGAEEMTARVIQYCAGYGIPIDPERMTSTTFNAFCQELIKRHYDELGYTMPPRVIPDETRSGIINRLLDSFPRIPEWNYAQTSNSKQKWIKSALSEAKSIFAEIKKEGYTREENPYHHRFDNVSIDLIFQMYDEYDSTLKMRNLLEYDDQILKVFNLIDVHPNLFEEIGYKHIIVDEFQDTDLPQINLLNQIIDTTKFMSFMAVGDDSQSIFAFRHTSPEYMINFENYFGRFDDFALVDNHRSNGGTIAFANKVNALNESRVEKDLIATKPQGVEPIINGFYSQTQEYKWIAEQIKEEIENGKTPSDIAFIASDRYELSKMASVLTSYGIPSILMNPIPFVDNSRVAALCTFFDSFVEGSSQGYVDYQNVLTHGGLKGATAGELEDIAGEFAMEVNNGARSLQRFIEFAKALDVGEVDECYQEFLEKIDFCQTMDELIEFFRDFKLYGGESMFKREGKYEGVCLTTVHSAKGLEWDITYLSLSKFDKPDYHRLSHRYAISEEKEEVNRKWFVGATRAREKLVMTGEYVLKFSNRECILNDYVKQAHELVNPPKPYAYSAGNYWATRDAEKREELEQSAQLRSVSKGGLTPDFAPGKKKVEPPVPNRNYRARGILELYGIGASNSRTHSQRQTENVTADDIEFI